MVDWGETLTLGEQQRLGLARLFHRRPQYAILVRRCLVHLATYALGRILVGCLLTPRSVPMQDECTSAVTMEMEERCAVVCLPQCGAAACAQRLPPWDR